MPGVDGIEPRSSLSYLYVLTTHYYITWVEGGITSFSSCILKTYKGGQLHSFKTVICLYSPGGILMSGS